MKFLRYAGWLLVGAWIPSALFAQLPTTVGLDRDLGPVRVAVGGDPGYDYTLEAATSLPPAGNWEFLATFNLSSDSQSWFDSVSAILPGRFYRTVKTDAAPPEPAPDFRLIDQTGKSRQLHYYDGMESVRAMVLIFTANGCAKLREMSPVIKSLTSTYASQGVLIWLVDSNTGDNRSNILVEATSLGMSNSPPILHDPSQIVASTYHVSASPEAIVINPDPVNGWTIFYRGAIDDRLGSNAVATTQNYLADALDTFLAGGTYSPKATRPAGCTLALNPSTAVPVYATEIAPLLQNRCVRCHSPGNLAPWSMTNYDVVHLYAPAIRETIMTGEMPPWHADNYYRSFTNDFSLKTDEASKLVRWLDAGAPRGTGPDPLADTPPPPTNYPYAWPATLGQPNAVLRIPSQSIPATGTVQYRYIDVTNNAFATDVWLLAAVPKPSNTRVVHHCLVFQGTGGLSGLDGFFAGYVPGSDPAPYPTGTAKLLKRGEVLRFQMHYTTVGSSQTDQTELGLYVAPAAPAYPLQTKSAFNIFFTLPPDSSEYKATAQLPSSGTLTTNILLYEVSPHMHLRGSAFKYDVIYPNNVRETLVSVPHFIFHWQALYRLTQPKYIPRGSRIECTAVWDNTSQNKELMQAYTSTGNTSYTPSRSVGFGEQSWDEMFIGYMNYAEVP